MTLHYAIRCFRAVSIVKASRQPRGWLHPLSSRPLAIQSSDGDRRRPTAKRTKSFDLSLRRFWFDTVLHNKKSLELLFDVVGTDRCMFGTERPGSGGGIDPASGRPYDDLRPVIEGIATIDEAAKKAIF